MKNIDRSALEQICERLAVMAYEVFMGQMAYGLKSISYWYQRKGSGQIDFEAAFVAFEDDEGFGPVAVQLTATPINGTVGKWNIEQGRVGYWSEHFNRQRPWRIRFDEGPIMVLTSSTSNHVMVGNGFDRTVELKSDFASDTSDRLVG